jgi:myo-inositol-1(or 4)-monophosphatase
MHPMLNIAVRAARSAGNIITRYSNQIDSLKVSTKRRNDFVSDVDRAAEEDIIRSLRRTYPDHGILAEESGNHSSPSGNDEFLWIIDPLDGTTNYLHGVPQYAVSIALQHKGRLELGVVYNPANQELYTAHRGGGAELNNRRIRVSKRRSLEGALLGTGFPYRSDQNVDAYLQLLSGFMRETAGLRRQGAASLDLAYVAAGRFDGFFELGLQPWDIAAGSLLIREAGGLVGDLEGGENWLDSGNVVAAGPKVYHSMLQAMQPYMHLY